MKTWIMFPLLAVLGACTYTGPPGTFDYGMAVGNGWVASLSNSTICRQPFALPSNLDPTVQRAECYANTSFIGCGGEAIDGVVQYAFGQFWYATLRLVGGGLCLSASAPNSDPFAITEQYYYGPEWFDGDVDRPQLAVTSDKVVLTAINRVAGQSRSRVWTRWNIPAGPNLIRHSEIVSLATPMGDGNDHVVWLRPSLNHMTFGRITGSPLTGGGTQTAAVTAAASGQPAYDFLCVYQPNGACLEPRGHQSLATHAVIHDDVLWSITRVDGGTQLSLARWDGFYGALNPQMREQHRIALPAGGQTFACESLSAMSGRVLIGFTSASPSLWATGYLVTKLPGQAPAGPHVYLPGTGTTAGRMDFCPLGVFIRDGNGVSWIGVGHQGIGGSAPGILDGRLGMICRQQGDAPCVGW